MTIICRETNSSFLLGSEIYYYILLVTSLQAISQTLSHLGMFRKILCPSQVGYQNISSIKGRMSSKTAGGWQCPIGDFRHSRYQKIFVFFLNFLNWYNTLCLEPWGYLSGDKLSPSHLSHLSNSSQGSYPIHCSHPNVSQSS